jgi:hypothetical protein
MTLAPGTSLGPYDILAAIGGAETRAPAAILRFNFCHSLVDMLLKLGPDLVQSRVFSVGNLRIRQSANLAIARVSAARRSTSFPCGPAGRIAARSSRRRVAPAFIISIPMRRRWRKSNAGTGRMWTTCARWCVVTALLRSNP